MCSSRNLTQNQNQVPQTHHFAVDVVRLSAVPFVLSVSGFTIIIQEMDNLGILSVEPTRNLVALWLIPEMNLESLH